MRSLLAFSLGLLLFILSLRVVSGGLLVPPEIEQPGTRPQQVCALDSPASCAFCHGGCHAANEREGGGLGKGLPSREYPREEGEADLLTGCDVQLVRRLAEVVVTHESYLWKTLGVLWPVIRICDALRDAGAHEVAHGRAPQIVRNATSGLEAEYSQVFRPVTGSSSI